MHFGIKRGSSKEITIEDIQVKFKEKIKENKDANSFEVFIIICHELAKEKNMTAAIHLEGAFIRNGNEMKCADILNVLFRKQK